MDEKTSSDRIYDMHAEICKMLSHPTRLKILGQLKDGKKTVGDIVNHLGMNQPTVSQHLGELKKTGLVRAERDGSNMSYELIYPEIMDACDIVKDILFKELSRNQDLLDQGGDDEYG